MADLQGAGAWWGWRPHRAIQLPGSLPTLGQTQQEDLFGSWDGRSGLHCGLTADSAFSEARRAPSPAIMAMA
jgi:hypothetical protein